MTVLGCNDVLAKWLDEKAGSTSDTTCHSCVDCSCYQYHLGLGAHFTNVDQISDQLNQVQRWCIFEQGQVRLHQRETRISWRGSAKSRWLYVLDADWSDLIDISDVTRTVYISFVTTRKGERLQPVVRKVFLAHFVNIPLSRRRNLRVGR